jgi:hypothetical protein
VSNLDFLKVREDRKLGYDFEGTEMSNVQRAIDNLPEYAKSGKSDAQSMANRMLELAGWLQNAGLQEESEHLAAAYGGIMGRIAAGSIK